MAYIHILNCCGINELALISQNRTVKDILTTALVQNQEYNYITNTYGRRTLKKSYRFLLFSQAGSRSKYGDRLAAYITEHKLGKVAVCGEGINPNTRRKIKAFMWTVDFDALEAHMQREGWLS